MFDHYNFELSSVSIKCLCRNLCLVCDSYSLPGKKDYRMCLNSFDTTVNFFNLASMNNKTFELISWKNPFAFLCYTFCKKSPFIDLAILRLLKHISRLFDRNLPKRLECVYVLWKSVSEMIELWKYLECAFLLNLTFGNIKDHSTQKSSRLTFLAKELMYVIQYAYHSSVPFVQSFTVKSRLAASTEPNQLHFPPRVSNVRRSFHPYSICGTPIQSEQALLLPRIQISLFHSGNVSS